MSFVLIVSIANAALAPSDFDPSGLCRDDRPASLAVDSGDRRHPTASIRYLRLFFLLAVYPRAQALEHPTRRRIYGHLLELPGDYFHSIIRSLGLTVGTARYHLEVLLGQGLLRSEKRSGRLRFYPKGEDAQLRINEAYETFWAFRDLRLRILFALIRHAIPRPTAIARSLGVSRQLVCYHLARLEEMGYVRREGHQYRATESIGQRVLEGAGRLRAAKPTDDEAEVWHATGPSERALPSRLPAARGMKTSARRDPGPEGGGSGTDSDGWEEVAPR